MTLTTKTTDRILGCDVSKDTVTFAFFPSKQTCTVTNTREELTRFLKTFKTLDLAVCEATGGYETTLLASLADLGLPAHRADAVKVKAFIRSLGIRAKTDAVDAMALARYGAERKVSLALWVIPPETRRLCKPLFSAASILLPCVRPRKTASRPPAQA